VKCAVKLTVKFTVLASQPVTKTCASLTPLAWCHLLLMDFAAMNY